jgi:hypothetical protein
MGRAGRIIGWRPVTYRGALLGLALGMCGAFALICVTAEALWTFLGVPWDWHAIRSGLLIGLVIGGPQMFYGVHKRRSRGRGRGRAQLAPRR